MSKKVTYARLHTGFFVPGFGNFKETLPPDGKTLKDFKMEKQSDGNLLLTWKDEKTATIQSYEISSSNIVGMQFEAEKIVKTAPSAGLGTVIVKESSASQEAKALNLASGGTGQLA